MRRCLAALLTLVLVACGGSDPTGTPDPEDGDAGGPGVGEVILSGSFHPVVHPGSGTASVYVFEDGSRELRLGADFVTDAGPQLEVWLVRADDAQDSETVIGADYISLGGLERAAGAQTYDIPANADLDTFRSVVVWCVPFSVNFTTAPLVMN